MVLLLGNYPPDQQQSMQRFGAMVLRGLRDRGIEAELIAPQPFLGRLGLGRFLTKWLGYIDKYIVFPRELRRRLKKTVQLVIHVCDHSNAVYVPFCHPAPVLVTCHDLLAVRGGLGEETDCPATFTGAFLQKSILSGLKQAEAIACASHATATDANRLLGQSGCPSVTVIPLGLSFPYSQVTLEEANERLGALPGLNLSRPFALHVGSNLRRKNREGVLRIFALTKGKWDGQMVFAGEPLSRPLWALAEQLEVAGRVLDVATVSNKLLEALYNT